MSDVLSTIKDVRDAIENGQSTAGYIESQIDAMTSASKALDCALWRSS